MGWIDDSSRHEGHVKVVFADGRLGGGVLSADGLSVDGPDGLAARTADGNTEMRPAAAVIGWRIACDHVPAHVSDDALSDWVGQAEHWLSPTVWHRVYSPAEENLNQHRIYAALDDEYSVHIDERDDDLEELLIAEWHAHLQPEDHTRSIRTAVDAITTAQQALDLEVAAARSAGLSWADIGRAAGVTRQAARERWGTREPRQ